MQEPDGPGRGNSRLGSSRQLSRWGALLHNASIVLPRTPNREVARVLSSHPVQTCPRAGSLRLRATPGADFRQPRPLAFPSRAGSQTGVLPPETHHLGWPSTCKPLLPHQHPSSSLDFPSHASPFCSSKLKMGRMRWRFVSPREPLHCPTPGPFGRASICS